MNEAKKGKKVVWGALAITAMLCIGALSAMGTPDRANTDRGYYIEALDVPLSTAKTLGYQGNVLISSDTPDTDDRHPSITVTAAGTSVVAYENAPSPLQTTVPICYSADGEAWTKKFEIDSTELSGTGVLLTPAVVYNPTEDEVFFTASDPMSEFGHFFGWIPGDIAGASAFKYLNAFSTEDAGPGDATVVGPWTVWVHIDDYESYDDGPHLKYLIYDDEDQTFKWPSDVDGNWAQGSYYDGESQLVTSPATNPAIDAGSQRMYMVMEHMNKTTGRSEIAYKSTVTDLDPNSDTFLFISGGGFGGMDKYADIEVWPWQMYMGKGDLFDSADPHVAASGTNVAVVYMTTDNIYGNWDIVCEYSSDSGATWETSLVAGDNLADDTNPAVFVSGNNVFVVYVSEGNLYLAKSEDGGATWIETEQVNEVDGTVVAEDGTADISAGGIVWTDNRNGDKDIYYAPLPVAIINVGTISGGMGVSATVTNTGTEDASAIDWTISLSGPVFVGKEASGTIDSLPAGGETTIGTGLVFGIGPTTITVTAGGATKTASGFVLGPLVLGL